MGLSTPTPTPTPNLHSRLLPKGSLISNYEIVESIGDGGMGVVYKARDHQLNRDVALKFLPAELSRDTDANERFVQEAQAASALNHPNICVLHDIKETDDGRRYIVMPWYEGQTLKYRLTDGALPTDEAIGIIQQIATGLSVAHQKGIIHRDIKPANIMVTDDNQVIILDFGVAKLMGGLDLTKTGSTVGTAFYMSPEQVRGETVDQRADLWSLGVVFYQLLTGSRPFDGAYEQAVSYAILNHDPLQAASLPDHLTDVLKQLLAKEPSDRFKSADELLQALDQRSAGISGTAASKPSRDNFRLGRVISVGIAVVVGMLGVAYFVGPWSADNNSLRVDSSTDRHTIAVLPFTNLRNDPETDYLAYAMADQVIGSLSYVKNLNVRPASSVRRYEHETYEAREAGEDLKVDYVLVGNYLQASGRTRLTVEMVDVASNEIIWKEPIEVKSDDVFEMQDIVTQTVLSRLKVSFSEDEQQRMQTDQSADPLAYELYLKAVALDRTTQNSQRALELVERSIAIDSMFAPAWAQLGFRRHALGMFGMEGRDVSVSSERAFLRALELNPQLVSALVDLSTYYTDSGRTDEAFELAQRVLRVNPNSAMAHFATGYVLRYAGLNEESLRHMMTAWNLDSTNTRFRSIGHNYVAIGDFERAMHFFSVDAPSPYYLTHMARALHRAGRVEEAIPFYRSAITADPGGLEGLGANALLAAIDGNHEIGLDIASQMVALQLVDAEIYPNFAAVYCLNGNVDRCNETLRYAVENGYFNVERFEGDVFLEAARGTPAFTSMLARAKERHEQFKAKKAARP